MKTLLGVTTVALASLLNSEAYSQTREQQITTPQTPRIELGTGFSYETRRREEILVEETSMPLTFDYRLDQHTRVGINVTPTYTERLSSEMADSKRSYEGINFGPDLDFQVYSGDRLSLDSQIISRVNTTNPTSLDISNNNSLTFESRLNTRLYIGRIKKREPRFMTLESSLAYRVARESNMFEVNGGVRLHVWGPFAVTFGMGCISDEAYYTSLIVGRVGTRITYRDLKAELELTGKERPGWRISTILRSSGLELRFEVQRFIDEGMENKIGIIRNTEASGSLIFSL